jgi:cytochrome c biogenesis factor
LRDARQPDLEVAMMRIAVACTVFALLLGAAFAHHGWGSYDAEKPVTVAGPVLTSKFENPHATITVRGSDKTWTVTLAPTSRMISRGATQAVIAVGNSISAYGYPSTVEKDEMRAERITVDGKTYEMR